MPLVYAAVSSQDLFQQLHALETLEGSGRWYFRGQGDSSWGLTPSLFREDMRKRIQDPRRFETQLLDRLRSVLTARSNFPERVVRDDDALIAFAQHHGVPTRGLDWTKSSWQAAYFAASDHVRAGVESSFSIFALAEIKTTIEQERIRTRLVRVPSSSNDNLEAQRGVLLIHDWEQRDYWDATRAIPISRPPAQCVGVWLDQRLIRIDIPSEHSLDVLNHLGDRGVDGVTSFPGNQGLARLPADFAFLGTPWG